MKPRDYQQAAVDAVWRYFIEGNKGNPIVAMPTGTGKSLVIAKLIETMTVAYPSTRVLVLTHVKELVDNNSKTLLRIMPHAPMGVYSAGLNKRDVHAPITFAGIASIARRAKLFARTDIIIIDECHLVSDSENTRYVALINAIRASNPHVKVIGLSATPWRLGMGHLTDGELFDDVCFDVTSGEAFVWMVQQGYLAPVVPRRPSVEIDTSDVSLRGGEFVSKALSESIDAQGVLFDAVDETVKYGLAQDRKHWLLFATSVDHCDQIAEYLTEVHGIPTCAIHSKLTNKERDQRREDFIAGKYRAAVNKDILTTGFDFPEIDLIGMYRPTQSPGLWVQMLGRGTRPVFADGFDLETQEGRLAAQQAGPKQDCLVLDFAGNTARLGPINYPTIPKRKRKGEGDGDPPARACPECGLYSHISLKECPECGFEFPREEKVQNLASTSKLIEDRKPVEPVFEVFPVREMFGYRHTKAGKPDSVRVDYLAGPRRFSVWVAVEHQHPFVRKKAHEWWFKHSRDARTPLPDSTVALLEVFDQQVRMPTHIRVRTDLKYPEIVDYDFTGTGFDFSQLGRGPVPSGPDSNAGGAGNVAPQLPDVSDFY